MGLDRRGIFLSLSAVLAIGVLFVVFAPTTQRELVQESRVQVQETVTRVNALETQELRVWLTYITRQTLNDLARGPPLSGSDTVPIVFRSQVLARLDAPDEQDRSEHNPLRQIEEFYREQFNYDPFELSLQSIAIRSAGFRSVVVDAEFGLLLVDASNSLRIDRTIRVQQLVSLEGLIDPIAHRDGVSHQRIRFADRIIRSSDDFFEHAREGTYVATNSSFPGIPYFERFQVSPQATRTDSIHFLHPPGAFGAQQRSYVDYYPQAQDPCLVGLQDPTTGQWVYLDGIILPFYGVAGYTGIQTEFSEDC